MRLIQTNCCNTGFLYCLKNIETPTSFDGRGNYTLGITEQMIFPEIEYDKVDRTRGMDITFVTTAENNTDAKALLDALGFPFKKN